MPQLFCTLTTCILFTCLLMTQTIDASNINAPKGKLIEAENPAPNSTNTIIEDAKASGGKAVTTDRNWEPMFFTSNLPDYEVITVFVRHRGGPFIVKVKPEDADKQKDLKSIWSSPESWTWTKVGTFPRKQLGEQLVIIRTNKGEPAIDCVVFAEGDVKHAKVLPPFEPDTSLPEVTATITADWASPGKPISRLHWGVCDYGILKPSDRENPKFIAYIADVKPEIIRIHWSPFADKWTNEATRTWNADEIKEAFDTVAPGYGDAKIMMNIPRWPTWFHDGKVLPEDKEDAFAALCAKLAKVMRDHVQRPVAYWEVLNENENAYEKAGKLDNLWRLLGKIMTAMRQVDPDAKFGGPALTWPKPSWMRGYMNALGDQVDFVTWHNYATDDSFLPNDQMFAKADNIANHAADAMTIIREIQPDRELETFLTEYNVSWTWTARDRRMTNNIGAIFQAMIVKRMVERDVTGAMVWHIKDGIYGLLDREGNRRPPSELFIWGNRHLVGRTVPVNIQTGSDHPSTETAGPPLEALAVLRDDGSQAALLINPRSHGYVIDSPSAIAGQATRLQRIDAQGIHPSQPLSASLTVPGYALVLLD